VITKMATNKNSDVSSTISKIQTNKKEKPQPPWTLE